MRQVVFVAAIVIVAGVAIALGRWQLRRLHARIASNRVLLRARAEGPVLLPGDVTLADSGRHATAHGTFDTTGQVLLRGRVQDEAPGLDVVTPFVLDSGGRVLWVLRGFVRSPDAATPPVTLPPPMIGETTIHGWLVAAPALADSGQPVHDRGTTTWRDLDRRTIHARRPSSLDLYMMESDDTAGPGHLAAVVPPPITDGPHLSYAVQWFGIALAVICFGVMILWRGDRKLPPDRAAP